MRSALDKAKESATKVAEKGDESEKLEEFKAQCAAALEEAIKHKRLIEETYKDCFCHLAASGNVYEKSDSGLSLIVFDVNVFMY